MLRKRKEPKVRKSIAETLLRDMQGTDVLRFLRGQKDLSQIVVIVWTSHIGPRDAEDVRGMDIRCCVAQPHSTESLNETIRGLNDYLVVQGLPALLHYGRGESSGAPHETAAS